ncbi:MAG: sugar phosphate isomerase/epimerase [Clostridiales bacterium]|nr:sugar phosphate isomerase/epimerase [Clostridiales bacterium]
MKISYSELIVLNQDVPGNIQKLIEAGSNHIELMMDAAGWDRYAGNYNELLPILKSYDVHYSVHPAAWDINLTAEMKILRDAAYQHHLEALDFCEKLGASHMVVHPGFSYSPCFNKETARKRAHEIICRLAEKAKDSGVKLAFENVGYNGTSIYSEEQYLSALNDVDPMVGYLIDTGHAHVNHWDIPKMIHTVSNRLFGLHIHDNCGNCDAHLPIGKGTIDWNSVIEAMKHIQTSDCEFVLEYAPMTPMEELAKGKSILTEALNKS